MWTNTIAGWVALALAGTNAEVPTQPFVIPNRAPSPVRNLLLLATARVERTLLSAAFDFAFVGFHADATEEIPAPEVVHRLPQLSTVIHSKNTRKRFTFAVSSPTIELSLGYMELGPTWSGSVSAKRKGKNMGQHQVTCINKRGDHLNPHERIEYIGSQQGNWKLAEDNAIGRIKNRTDSFFTLVNGRHADVVVATHNGREYLKTTADGYSPDNLLSLNECANCRVIT